MDQLSGKVAVITGAASGIGLALAQRCASEGMRVVMADVEQPALESAGERIGASGASVITAVTDVASPESVDALARLVDERLGPVDLLCNNAGVIVGGLSWDLSVQSWEWVLGVNLWGVVNGIRAFVPRMVERGIGHVVNTASVAGLLASPGIASYNASKHAVVAISETLHHELAMVAPGVRVSVLCPGFVRTQIMNATRNWPEKLGASPARRESEGGTAEVIEAWMRHAVDDAMDPAEVARIVIEAVRSDEFWILTHRDAYGSLVRDRYAGAAEGRNPPTFSVG
jgi:NAD(P)-dependent dehydrogenase (short-subunit alcohol dehydrogenase family)